MSNPGRRGRVGRRQHRARGLWLAVAVTLALAAGAAADDVMRVHAIDVGQGAATLVEFPCAAVLIDTGGERWPQEEWAPPLYDSTAALIAYLDAIFAARPALGGELAVLFLTHPHLDHTRGVPAVLTRYRPRHVVHNGQRRGSGVRGQDAARRYAQRHPGVASWEVVEVAIADRQRGLSNAVIDPIDCAGTDPRIRVLWGQVRDRTGWDPADFEDENNHSLVIRIDYGEASILFTGDLEEAQQRGRRAGIERLLAAYRSTGLLDVDVYHVGHHGSRNGTTPALLEAISPEIALIAAGPACPRGEFSAWSFGHPRAVTVTELEHAVSRYRAPARVQVFPYHRSPPRTRTVRKAIYSTGWDGTIVLEAGADGDWRVAETSGAPPCLRR